MGVNKVILLGNLGKDPELRYTANTKTPVSTLRLATTEKRRDANGNWVDQTEWHNVVTFGRTAENCSKFLKKGKQIFVEGRLQTRKWQDKEGKDRYTTEVLANSVQFIGSAGAREDFNGDSSYASSLDSSVEEQSAGQSFVNSLKSADEISGLDAGAISSGATASSGGSMEVAFEDDDIPF